jgi:hypothetical protein
MAAYETLRRLNGKLDLGLPFAEYSQVLANAQPAIQDFLESRDAEQLPFLRQVVDNAWHCHIAAKRLWNEDLFGPPEAENPYQPFEVREAVAQRKRAKARKRTNDQLQRLWLAAGVNLVHAQQLLEGTREDREATILEISRHPEELTAAYNMARATRDREKTEAQEAAEAEAKREHNRQIEKERAQEQHDRFVQGIQDRNEKHRQEKAEADARRKVDSEKLAKIRAERAAEKAHQKADADARTRESRAAQVEKKLKPHQVRTWTLTISGKKKSVKASLQKIINGQAILEPPDGKTLKPFLAHLSPKDRDWIRDHPLP